MDKCEYWRPFYDNDCEKIYHVCGLNKSHCYCSGNLDCCDYPYEYDYQLKSEKIDFDADAAREKGKL